MWRDALALAGSVLIAACLVFGLLFLVRLLCWPFSMKIREDMRTRRMFHRVWGCFGAFSAIVLLWDIIPFFWRSNPTTEREKRQYGIPLIYKGAPFSCLYVGLWPTETGKFEDAFWRFADHHDIRKPAKDYWRYSGPPLATCESDHVAVYLSIDETTNLIERHLRMSRPPFSEQPVHWQSGIWFDAYWPTNAGYISIDGHEVRAPLTGKVDLAANDTNYSRQDFKQLVHTLTIALQVEFPNRAVKYFSYDGNKR